jgi:hypothetical protein
MQLTFEAAANSANQRLQWKDRATGWTQLSFDFAQRAGNQHERVSEGSVSRSRSPSQGLVHFYHRSRATPSPSGKC